MELFQNISCYCLTIQCHLLNASKWISKHLMLLFNFHQSFVPVVPLHISKHLMLLFNNEQIEGDIKNTDFKTSHVIV